MDRDPTMMGKFRNRNAQKLRMLELGKIRLGDSERQTQVRVQGQDPNLKKTGADSEGKLPKQDLGLSNKAEANSSGLHN